MDLYRTIMHMYPDAVVNVDFGLQDNSDGNGPFIAYWTYPHAPQPTQAELEAAWLEIVNTPVSTPMTLDQQIQHLQQNDKDQSVMIDLLAQTVFV